MHDWKQDAPMAMPVTISPKMAAAMLGTSSGNRKMRMGYVERLADAMRRGEWRLTNQGIGFDTSGALRDGHHRLSACVRSGVSIRAMLVLGMPETAYQVIDTGATRSYADRLAEPRMVAQVLAMAATILHRCNAVTTDQILPLKQTKLYGLAGDLWRHCNTNRHFFSATPIRLAACVCVMDGAPQSWVWGQYRAMVALDFDAMTPASQALVRQVQRTRGHGKSSGGVWRNDVLARGLRVFDPSRAHLSKIQIGEGGTEAATGWVRGVLERAVQEHVAQSTFDFGGL